jgi:hypothetical protein
MRLREKRESQNSPQQTSPKIEEDDEEKQLDKMDEEDEEEEKPEPKQEIRPQIRQEIPQKENPEEEKLTPSQRAEMEIELLQNNGRYRVELLHRLNEMNKALNIITECLVDLIDGGKKSN